uniref:Anoctamin transmembrane domain-containing protein n=1 Tax=Chromera velia CCMP2878 TaxID=1169474 RepID=A0A0G4HKC6_9ALVE|eukprot:Cvel_1113.t1-p1 / transcript=Cvel_1113.t1 / gene=Cvel_1113 / organism=Chromera_velia_CCMP2878 / gene_product=Anoctamin-8, putative / transcript_product=Anoctamin-8, putative / location=Cvel_scaffold36:122124-129991(+) / protein_length=828 / sequence_SO=supercontig / SO=protein_coding / is_pseudo=false
MPQSFSTEVCPGSEMVLLFNEKITPEQIDKIGAFLEARGFFVEVATLIGAEMKYIHLSAPLSLILLGADAMFLSKQLKTGGPPICFEIENATEFLNFDPKDAEFTAKNFLTFSETTLVASDILHDIEADTVAEILQVDPFENMITTLLSHEILAQGPCYLHDLDVAWDHYVKIRRGIPLRWDLIPLRDYLGEEIAFYFIWMQYYTIALAIPAMLGVLCFLVQLAGGSVYKVLSLVVMPVFSLCLIGWAFVWLKCWVRQSARLSFKWGSDFVEWTETVRPSFKGELRPHPVTRKPTRWGHWKKRLPAQIFSVFITMLMLGVVFAAMIVGMNVQGYILHKESWMYIPSLARLAEKGEIFDVDSMAANVPVALHCAFIQVLNIIYRYIGEWLTEMENYRTQTHYETALVIKRFSFEAVNCYLPLFWLAFYAQDMERLSQELSMLFFCDQSRRMLLELIVPYMYKRGAEKYAVQKAQIEELEREKQKQAEAALAAQENGEAAASPPADAPVTKPEEEGLLSPEEKAKAEEEKAKEAEKDGADLLKNVSPREVAVLRNVIRMEVDGGMFDDYMEICIQFGSVRLSSLSSSSLAYVILFASAWSLGPFLAFGANIAEMHQDIVKFMTAFQRMRPKKSDSVGIWLYVILCIATLSIFTNCFLFTFASGDLVSTTFAILRFLERKFTDLMGGMISYGHNWNLRDVFAFCEHLMFIICFGIWLTMPSVPYKISLARAAKEYAAQQRRNDAIHSSNQLSVMSLVLPPPKACIADSEVETEIADEFSQTSVSMVAPAHAPPPGPARAPPPAPGGAAARPAGRASVQADPEGDADFHEMP